MSEIDGGMDGSSRAWVYMALFSLCGHVAMPVWDSGNVLGGGWLFVLSAGFFIALIMQIVENFQTYYRK